MFVVDTNVLVHAIDASSPWHAPCRSALERWRAQPARWHLTWSIVYEFLTYTTHRRAPRPLAFEQAWGVIEGLLRSPGLEVLVATPRHAALVSALPRDLSGDAVHDAHVVVLMREHGVRRIYTRDRGFRRYQDLEVIDPALPPTAAEPPSTYRARGKRRDRRVRHE